MACNIINSKHIKVNGGSTLYGGAITNVSLNFGGLSSGHRASVTVVKQSGDLSTPNSQDAVTITLLGLNLQMHVGGYNKSTSASSATQMTINLYDQSNKFLDHDFIVLAEEFPKLGSTTNIHIIGDKYGTLPHKQTAELTGSIVPDADTKWGSIRKFFKDLKKPAGFFGGGGNLLEEAEVDSFVKSASGKTLYYTQEDESGAKVLNDVLGELILGKFDNLAFDFSGSFREVIVSICNALGYFAYWDMSQQKVKIVKSFDSAAGSSVLNSIAKSCNAINTSESEDFTVTSSQSALGTFSSSDPGETSTMYGAGVTRFHKAVLLQPDFHYSPCSDVSAKKLEILDFENEDVLKAITASQDSKVYAMYVLQSMLGANSSLEFDPEGDVKLPGRGNEKEELKFKGKEEFEIAPTQFGTNSLFEKYYEITSKNSTKPCEGHVYPVLPKLNSKSLEEIKILEKGWNATGNIAPAKFAGECNEGVFDEGIFMVHDGYSFSTILDEDSELNGSNDILRDYLKAISEFKNRFYVIKEQLGLRSVGANSKKHDYGFYMTSASAGPSANFNVENGYKHIPINPYLSLNDTGGEFKALGKAIFAMYKKEGSVDEFLSKTPVVELIRALDNNELKLFVTDSYAKSVVVDQNQLNDEDFDEPAINMHLIVKEKSNINSPFAENTEIEVEEGGFHETKISSKAVSISKKIYTVAIGKASPTLEAMFKEDTDKDEDWNLVVITGDPISQKIQPSIFEENPLEKIKMQYNVEGLQSTIKKSSGHFLISAAEVKNDKKVWKGNLIQNISINAADVGATNDIFNKFGATAADDSYVYSDKNQKTMTKALETKVRNNTWVDGVSARSESLQFVLTGSVTLPSIEQGLQSLSIQSNDGNIIVDVSVGNENAKKAQMAMRQMRSEGSKLRHGYGSIIPDGTENFSPKFVALAKGILR